MTDRLRGAVRSDPPGRHSAESSDAAIKRRAGLNGSSDRHLVASRTNGDAGRCGVAARPRIPSHIALPPSPEPQPQPVRERLENENDRLSALVDELQAELDRLRLALRGAMNDALTDSLTGLANRRSFELELAATCDLGNCRSLKPEFDATSALGELAEPAQLLIVDIDHFKQLNDTHGHDFGDAVLRIVGKLLAACVRGGTMVSRVGGDEFALLLPGRRMHDTARIDPSRIAQRLCDRLAQRRLAVRGHPGCSEQVTVSIGVAGWRPDEDPGSWYARADAALYAAKRSGRNRVVIEAA